MPDINKPAAGSSPLYFTLLFLILTLTWGRAGLAQGPADPEPLLSAAGPRPDRILLTWVQDPQTTQTVTWRTDTSVKKPLAQVALAEASPSFTQKAVSIPARSKTLKTESGSVAYHQVTFKALLPGNTYAYRVGDGIYWSEWFQFRTASTKTEPFSFIYLGDAQTELHTLWSRTIREAYATAPKARFIVHAGDLVNNAESDSQWQEWFAAGSFIHATIPGFFTPGNHEYTKVMGLPHLSKFWDPQINLPRNGPPGRQDAVYYFDYPNLRLISLNTYWLVAEQVHWLEKVLKDNPQKWTVVVFHYPIIGASAGRNYPAARKHWQPLLDKYKVDLVLQGHDHTYARGTGNPADTASVITNPGPVYVVSVSGPKMYHLTDNKWMARAGENIQLYQVIDVANEKMTYKSYTATGELYDAFELHKAEGLKKLVELEPEVKSESRRQK